MPTGTPIFLKVGPGGILFPYYEGHFKGVSGGSTSAIEIEVRTRKAGEVFAPEYYPDYVTFKTPKTIVEMPGGGALVRKGAPIALFWAETPDPDNPPAGELNRDRLLIAVGGSRLLLDEVGKSDFAQKAEFVRLPQVTANTTRGANQQICGWSWMPTVPGNYIICVTGSGYVSAIGASYYQVLVNNIAVAGGNLYFNQTGVHQTLIPQFGGFTVPNPPTLQTILVKAAINTDPNADWYNGIIIPLQ